MTNALAQECQRLQDAWYNYVSLDHHKDRDCHFYVELDYAYDGTDISHAVTHHGYIYHDELRLEGNGTDYLPTLKKAILTVVKDQLTYVNNVLSNPDSYDTAQRAQVKQFQELFKEWL